MALYAYRQRSRDPSKVMRMKHTPSPLSTHAQTQMELYINWLCAECLGEDEIFPLAAAWRQAITWPEQSLIAAAIVYRNDALADPPFRILKRGRSADERLCIVADELGLD